MVKFGIVGAGIIADAHKEAILANGDCEITAICDIALEKAQALAEGTCAKVYADYKEMQEKERPDAVILNLPHFLHMEVTVYFLQKGVAVLCEKPMANTLEECDKMIEAAEKSGTPLAIGHVQRYFEAHRELRKIIKEERLGKLCSFSEIRNTDYFTGRPKWFLTRSQAGGGIVMNYCAHTLDKLFYTTGLKVERVMACGSNKLNDSDVEASAQILLQLSDNVTASLTYCGCRVPIQYDVYFYFTKGTAWLKGGSELYISQENKGYERVELDYETGFFHKQLAEFLKYLKGEESEMVTPQYGREVISVIEEILEQIYD